MSHVSNLWHIHAHTHTHRHCRYAQETINYASLLTRPVTRQMNRKTKLARALATENLLHTHTQAVPRFPLTHRYLHLIVKWIGIAFSVIYTWRSGGDRNVGQGGAAEAFKPTVR